MTDMSKTAIDKASGMCRLHGLHGTEQLLRALSARIAELEGQNRTPNADFERGYAKGLRDAVEAIDNADVQEAYDQGHRVHFDDLQDFFADRVDNLTRATPKNGAVHDAALCVEALKTKGQEQ